MKVIIILLTSFMASINLYAEGALQDKINELDGHSKKLLGVSIYATAELINMDGSPIFAPLKYVQESGNIVYLRELESKGYINIRYQKGLPDGTAAEQEFIWYIRTDEGNELQRCFEMAQHNNLLQRTSR